MVHSFKVNDEYFVFDSESGSLHTADRLVFALLNDNKEILSQYSADETAEAQAEIEALKEKGLLFSAPQTSVEGNYEAGIVKSLCLHLSHDCNLRCRYCFANQGDYHGKRENMPLNVALKAVDMLIAKSGAVKNLEMDFFGGEPLMNFDVLRQTVSYAKEQAQKAGKIFKFTCTTNGLLLDREKSDYLNEEMDNVVLSLDGRREVNDFARPCPNGRGSFDLIVDNFRYFRSIRGNKSYFLRGTFTHFNTDFAKDVLFMRELGFEQLSVEPAVLPRGSEMEIKDSDLPEIFGQYEELAKQYVKLRKKPETWFSFFHFNIDLENGPCLKKRLKGCGAGCEYLAVVPDGGVYPCHQFAGEKEYLLGNVFDMSLDESKRKIFASSNLFSKEDCKDCWAKYLCSGGCSANAVHFNGDINKPFSQACALMKKRTECALYVYAKERLI